MLSTEAQINILAQRATTRDCPYMALRRGNPLWLPHFKIHENLCFSTYSLFANLFTNALEAAPVETLITVSLSYDKQNAIIDIHNKGAVPKAIRQNFFDISPLAIAQ